MSEASEVALRTASERAQADEWALVLMAEGMASRVRAEPGGFLLWVSAGNAERAEAALSAYERENPPRPARRGVEPTPFALKTGLLFAGALLAFFVITGPRDPAVAWFEHGSAQAARILDGELWRTVTALTLHADSVHVLANALAGALFVGAVCGALGPGLGLGLVLLAGAGGNLANAIFQRAQHTSVGASTAVFGAVGVLSALAMARRLRGGTGRRAMMVPFAAGLAVLAMLGTSGERVDVWAHLFGFLSGVAVGLPAVLAAPRRPGALAQGALVLATLAAVAYCWWLALGPGQPV